MINAAFGQGIGPVLLSNVMCSGFEHRLLDCLHNGIEMFTCSHSFDAGVTCSAGNWNLVYCNYHNIQFPKQFSSAVVF